MGSGSGFWGLGLGLEVWVQCRNLIKKPWACIRVPYMNPTIFGVMGPGFLNQVPTLVLTVVPHLQVRVVSCYSCVQDFLLLRLLKEKFTEPYPALYNPFRYGPQGGVVVGSFFVQRSCPTSRPRRRRV